MQTRMQNDIAAWICNASLVWYIPQSRRESSLTRGTQTTADQRNRPISRPESQFEPAVRNRKTLQKQETNTVLNDSQLKTIN